MQYGGMDQVIYVMFLEWLMCRDGMVGEGGRCRWIWRMCRGTFCESRLVERGGYVVNNITLQTTSKSCTCKMEDENIVDEKQISRRRFCC